MAAYTAQRHFMHQTPLNYCAQVHPYQHAFHHCPSDSARGPSHTPSAPMSDTDPRVQVLLLQKDLEFCHVEKAEAELSVQYLAMLCSKNAARPEEAAKKIAKLEEQLVRAREETQKIMESFQHVLAMARIIASNGTTTRAKLAESKNADLIDLSATDQDLVDASSTDQDTTLLDDDGDEVSSDLEPPMDAAREKVDPYAVSNSYIHRFTSDSDIVSNTKAGNIPAKSKSPEHDSETTSSFDSSLYPQSETSIEPESDGFFQTYVSAANTSNSVPMSSSEAEPLVKISDSKAARNGDTEVLAIAAQQWNMAKVCATVQISEPILEGNCIVEVAAGDGISGLKEQQDEGKDVRKDTSWTTRNLSPIRRERGTLTQQHKKYASRDESAQPDFYRYGIHYKPNPKQGDIYRTVLIEGLSIHITIGAVLNRVRGGAVVDAKLVSVVSSISRNKTALIVFVHEHSALAFEEYAGSHPVTFMGEKAYIRALTTPTWPMRLDLCKNINFNGYTRCLQVHDFPECIAPSQLRSDLRMEQPWSKGYIERMHRRMDGLLELRFTSIAYAGQAFSILKWTTPYKSLKVRFVADPCAQPLESLGAINDQLESPQSVIRSVEMDSPTLGSFSKDESPFASPEKTASSGGEDARPSEHLSEADGSDDSAQKPINNGGEDILIEDASSIELPAGEDNEMVSLAQSMDKDGDSVADVYPVHDFRLGLV